MIKTQEDYLICMDLQEKCNDIAVGNVDNIQDFNSSKGFLLNFFETEYFQSYTHPKGSSYYYINDQMRLPLTDFSGRPYSAMPASSVNTSNWSEHWLADRITTDVYIKFYNTDQIRAVSIFQYNRFPHEYPNVVIIEASDDDITYFNVGKFTLKKTPEDIIIFPNIIKLRLIRLTFPGFTRVCITKIRFINELNYNNHLNLMKKIGNDLQIRINEYREANKKRFSERYSLETNTSLVDNFSQILNTDNKFITFRPVSSAIKSKSSAENILIKYRIYLNDKLTRFDYYGIDSSLVTLGEDPRYLVRKRPDGSLSSHLMENRFGDLIVGPGIDYMWPVVVSSYYKTVYWNINNFHHLIETYMQTKDIEYVKKWIDYLDDWSLNYEIKNKWNEIDDLAPDGINDLIIFYKYLGTLARFHRTAYDLIPTSTILRTVLKLFEVNLPAYTVYMRNNSQNWRADIAPVNLALCFLFDEFTYSQFCLTEGIKAIDDYSTNVILPDGAATQQCPWYNYIYFHHMDALQFIRKRRRALYFLSNKESFYFGNTLIDCKMNIIADKVSFFLSNHVQYNNQYPSGARQDNRSMTATLISDDGICSGISSWSPNNSMRDSSKSVCFPYGGFCYLKSDKSCLFLFNSPKPGAGAGYRSMKNNNSVTLSYDGLDILVTDEVGSYSFVNTPVCPIIDKELNQNFHIGVPIDTDMSKRHKGYIVNAWTEPAKIEWRFNDDIDIVRSTYSGPYETQTNVIHIRTIIFMKQFHIWLIHDRILQNDIPVRAIQKFWTPSYQNAILQNDCVYLNNNYVIRQYHHDNIDVRDQTVPSGPYKIYDLQSIKSEFVGDIITVIAPNGTVVNCEGLQISIQDSIFDFNNMEFESESAVLPTMKTSIDILIPSSLITLSKRSWVKINDSIIIDDRIQIEKSSVVQIKNSQNNIEGIEFIVWRPYGINPIATAKDSIILNFLTGDWRKLFMMMNITMSKGETTTSLFNLSHLGETTSSYLIKYNCTINLIEGVYCITSPVELVKMTQLLDYDILVKINGVLWQPTINHTYPGQWVIFLKTGSYNIEINYINYSGSRAFPYPEMNITSFIRRVSQDYFL